MNLLSVSIALRRASTSQQMVRQERRCYLVLYYLLGILCLAAATFLNYSLNTGYRAELKFGALLLLMICMFLMIGSSKRYEERCHAAHQRVLHEPTLTKLP